jgi:hypothetical protein
VTCLLAPCTFLLREIIPGATPNILGREGGRNRNKKLVIILVRSDGGITDGVDSEDGGGEMW